MFYSITVYACKCYNQADALRGEGCIYFSYLN